MINDINTLADYLGPRDLPALTPAALEGKYGIPQADAFVLFGSQLRARLAGQSIAGLTADEPGKAVAQEAHVDAASGASHI